MENAAKAFIATPVEHSRAPSEESLTNLQSEAAKIAVQLSLSLEQGKSMLVAQATARPFRVMTADAPGAPFYWVDQMGQQTMLHINKSHRFYQALYAAPGSSESARQALEAMLVTLGLIELQAKPVLAQQVTSIRACRSESAEKALAKLCDDESAADIIAVSEEIENALPTLVS